MSKVEKAIEFAVNIANDNSHGYDQISRWSPDYDCSSLVISAFESAGIPVRTNGATYTGNMKSVFIKCGFKCLPYTGENALKRGDVLLNEKHHTALYLGSHRLVQASINEKGKIMGGKQGDQTGGEIAVRSFYEYKHGWQYVLRYEENNEEVIKVNIEMPRLTIGAKGAEVSLAQTLLKTLGYTGKTGRPLTVDGDFGSNTLYAVVLYQKSIDVTPDGIIGQLTWNALLHSHY